MVMTFGIDTKSKKNFKSPVQDSLKPRPIDRKALSPINGKFL